VPQDNDFSPLIYDFYLKDDYIFMKLY